MTTAAPVVQIVQRVNDYVVCDRVAEHARQTGIRADFLIPFEEAAATLRCPLCGCRV